MSLTIEIAADADATTWDDITGYVPWDQGMRCGGQASYGEVGTASGWNLDDDAASAVLPVKRVIRMIETATTPDTVMFKGRVSDKTLARGTKHEDDATNFDTSLDDNNAQLQGIPVDGWKRPEESGRTRIRALMAEFCAGDPRPSTDLDYTTYVPNTNTITMPPKTYTNTNVAEVAKECADTEGKQVFVTSDDELFYDLDTSTAYAATLAITDDNPNLTSQFPPEDPSGDYQGNEFVSGATIKYGDKNRSVSDVNATAEANHDYWRVILTDGGKNATQAAAKLATLLSNQSQEEQTFRCSILLLKTQVDKVKYGQTLSFRSGAAGVTTPRTLRVTQLLWEPVGPDHYKAHLELGVPTKFRRKLRNAPADPPANPLDDSPFVCDPTDFSVPVDPSDSGPMESHNTGAGNNPSLSYTHSPQGDNSEPASYGRVLLYAGCTYAYAYTLTHGPANCDITLRMASIGGGGLEGDEAMGATCGCGGPAPITNASGTFAVSGSPGSSNYWELGIWHTNFTGCGEDGTEAHAEILYVSGPDPRFVDLGECSNGYPRLGQRVIETVTSDGSTLTGTTNHAYSEGSLDIKVAGVHLPVVETDPLAGQWTLLEAPPAGAIMEITYRASDPTPLGTGNPYLDAPDAAYNIPYTMLGTGGDGSGSNTLYDDGTWGPPGGGTPLTSAGIPFAVGDPEGTTALVAGVLGYVEVPFDCTIVAGRLFAAPDPCDVEIDIWKSDFATYPPTIADTIVAAAPLTIVADDHSEDTTLTGWDVDLVAGDILAFYLASVTDAVYLAISLRVTKV